MNRFQISPFSRKCLYSFSRHRFHHFPFHVTGVTKPKEKYPAKPANSLRAKHLVAQWLSGWHMLSPVCVILCLLRAICFNRIKTFQDFRKPQSAVRVDSFPGMQTSHSRSHKHTHKSNCGVCTLLWIHYTLCSDIDINRHYFQSHDHCIWPYQYIDGLSTLTGCPKIILK